MLFFFARACRGLKSCTSLLENVRFHVPPSNLRDFPFFGVFPSKKHYILLGVPMLPACWVMISTYLQSEQLLSIIFILFNLKFLIIFFDNSNVLCYVVLSYHVLVTSLHFCSFTFLY
jgi:hypothetical protein